MKIEELKKLYLEDEINEAYNVSTPQKTERGTYLVENMKEGQLTEIESLNIQTSKYHQELLLDHIAIVAHKMYELTVFTSRKQNKIAVAIAILHDLGKKFTVKINQAGEICYWNHEILSAYLARDYMLIHNQNDYFTDEVINMISIVIHQHLQLKLICDDIARRCYIEGFRKIYGEEAYNYLEMLDQADQGYPEGSEIDYNYIEEGYSIIEKYYYL